MAKKKKKIGKVPQFIKMRRKVDREIAIEEGAPQVQSKTFLTHQKDIAEREKNTVRLEDIE